VGVEPLHPLAETAAAVVVAMPPHPLMAAVTVGAAELPLLRPRLAAVGVEPLRLLLAVTVAVVLPLRLQVAEEAVTEEAGVERLRCRTAAVMAEAAVRVAHLCFPRTAPTAALVATTTTEAAVVAALLLLHPRAAMEAVVIPPSSSPRTAVTMVVEAVAPWATNRGELPSQSPLPRSEKNVLHERPSQWGGPSPFREP
jgi:hypothetical protein